MGMRQVESTIFSLRIRMRYCLIIVRIRMQYRSKTSGSARGSGMYRTCGSAEKVRPAGVDPQKILWTRTGGSAKKSADPLQQIRKKSADLLKRIHRKKCGSAQADPQ